MTRTSASTTISTGTTSAIPTSWTCSRAISSGPPAPLEELSRFLGLPGKQGMRGGDVEGRYFAGEIGAIRDYCEADALLIWLIHLRFDRLRGRLDEAELADELALVRAAVRDRPHLQAFADVREPR